MSRISTRLDPNEDPFRELALATLARHNRWSRKYDPAHTPGTDAGAGANLLGSLGFDVKAVADLEKSSVARARQTTEQAKAGLAKQAADLSKYTALRRRLASTPPGAVNLVPLSVTTLWTPVPMGTPPNIREGRIEGSTEIASTRSVANGSGSGTASWRLSDADEEHNCSLVGWNFLFTPSESRVYSLAAWLWFQGHYVVYADDGVLNSRDAWARISVGATMVQPVGGLPDAVYSDSGGNTISMPGEQPPFFDVGDDNIDAHDVINDVEIVSHECEVTASIPVGVVVYAILETYAKGGGSVADLDFTGAGKGIACPLLRVY